MKLVKNWKMCGGNYAQDGGKEAAVFLKDLKKGSSLHLHREIFEIS